MATEILRPNGVGDEENINFATSGSNWENVDEEVADNDTTRIINTLYGGYQRDLYDIENSEVGAGTINKITIHFRCKCNGTAAHCKSAIKTNGTTYDGDEKTFASAYSWLDFVQEYAENPYTETDWNWIDIANLQIGISLESTAGKISYCTQVYVEIDYEEVATGTNTQINIGDDWKEISAVQINIGDDWKEVAGAQINIGDSWKEVF